jgi:LPS export ABC transporter protein LptC
MPGRVTKLIVCVPALLIAVLLLSACENDLNKVKATAAADSTKAIDRTVGVDMTFSDSAKVKLRLTAPLSVTYNLTKNPYTIMPKGVKVVFYNDKIQEIGNIIADTGINHETQKLIEFKKNVVATNPEGTVYKSDQLIWDQTKKEIYSKKQVVMTKVGGDVMTGTSFVSDEKLQHPRFKNSTAIIHVDNSIAE